jgi:phosphoribosylanthranilate isomerase
VKTLVKICGTNNPANIRAIAALPVHLIGFIFHERSPRHALRLDPAVTRDIPPAILKTGVFVNAPVPTILATARAHHLQAVQLHGEETPDTCRACRDAGLTVIKAIPVAPRDDPRTRADPYTAHCHLLLFDTRSAARGGTGKPFDWTLLHAVQHPFILAGGISPGDATRLRQWQHPYLHAVDLNSQFETAAGIKNITAIQQFIQKLNP